MSFFCDIAYLASILRTLSVSLFADPVFVFDSRSKNALDLESSNLGRF